ncbi:MAG: hypothetical protein D3924_00275 [Candidatus Electrothrix sp. AR4]|nr:hypothetical protein [Candidatus Electrothrix sp. AR4]
MAESQAGQIFFCMEFVLLRLNPVWTVSTVERMAVVAAGWSMLLIIARSLAAVVLMHSQNAVSVLFML